MSEYLRVKQKAVTALKKRPKQGDPFNILIVETANEVHRKEHSDHDVRGTSKCRISKSGERKLERTKEESLQEI